MGRLVLMWVLLSVVLCGAVSAAETAAPSASPQAPPPPSSPAPFPLEWVRLVPTATLKKFYAAQEYISRDYKLYWRTKEVDEVMEEELYKGIKQLVNDIVIREEASDDAKSLGTIRSTITNQVLSLTFQAEGATEMVPFTPDLYVDGRLFNTVSCHDNHPYCHQTITASKGDWVQLPPHPWSKPGWINIKTYGLSVRPLGSGNEWSTMICPPYELDGKSIIVYGRTDGGLCVGAASTGSINNFLQLPQESYPKDAYEGRANAAVDEIKWEKLVDPDGRLRLKLATKPELAENVKLLPQPNMGWIGLFDPEWENWLSEVHFKIIGVECKDLDDEQYRKCRERVCSERKLDKSVEIPVHESPDPSSPRIGTIVVHADLDAGASGKFRAEGSDKLVAFKADESGRRGWNYAIQFHQTYLDKKGTWYKLPANPLPRPGWIDISRVTKEPSEVHEIFGIFTDMKRAIIVLGVAADGSGLCVRDENGWDHACGAEVSDEEITLDKVRMIHWKDLLDKDGHLLLHEVYTEGC